MRPKNNTLFDCTGGIDHLNGVTLEAEGRREEEASARAKFGKKEG